MSSKKKLPEIVTAKGIAVYPKLNEPDTKYDKDGVYEVKLTFEDPNEPQVQAMVARIERERDAYFDAKVADLKAEGKGAAAKQLKKADILKPELDRETGDETGRYYIKAKMKASGTRPDGKPWTQQPTYFSASGSKLNNPPRIGGGSVLKLGVALSPYVIESSKEVGVTLRLRAVQIISLVTGGQRSFESYGFSAEEGDEIEDCEFDASSAEGSDAADDEDDDL
ncbi:MAG: hypothetical protein ACK4TR_09000 [Phenylobacterium sp.]|uniref:hypothetical protein n=1 Tax=Phenylobacterium sp. TaxID=1871053 RepID=UPI00391ABF13